MTDALLRRAEDACRPCGPCDAGLPMGCNCDPEPRAVIAGLLARLAAVEAQLALVRDHILTDRAHSHCPARAAVRAEPSEAIT